MLGVNGIIHYLYPLWTSLLPATYLWPATRLILESQPFISHPPTLVKLSSFLLLLHAFPRIRLEQMLRFNLTVFILIFYNLYGMFVCYRKF